VSVTTRDSWLSEFHRGSRESFAELYRDHFETVEIAVGRVLSGADKETVIHEVFCYLMTSAEARRGFHGGSLSAWLMTLSRNKAIDFQRRRRREQPMGTDPERFGGAIEAGSFEHAAEARLLLERFRGTVLPRKWQPVFDARFVEQLEQHQAAKNLRMSRTTLAYQEYRIRKLLRRFVLAGRTQP